MSSQGAPHRATTGTPSRACFAGLLTLLLLAPLAAQARPGDGIKMGPGRLKLGAEVESRYDSQAGVGVFGNYLNPGDALLVGRGVLQLDIPGSSARIHLKGGLDWNQYLGVVTSTTRGLSFLGANVDGTLAFNPEGQVGLDVTSSLNRSDRVSNPAFGLGVLGLHTANKARLRFRPGGGALDFGLSYEFNADLYTKQVSPEDPREPSGLCLTDPFCNPDLAPAFNALGQRVGADLKWRFLPKTGLTLEADYGWRSYLFGQEHIPNVGSNPLRVVAGFGTLLTTRLSFALRAGYQGIFFDPATNAGSVPDLHTWLGHAELGFRLTETFQLRGGYSRNFEPIGGSLVYYGDDRLYLDFRAQFSRLVVTALASVDLIGYGATPRSDLAFTGQLRGEYFFTNWFRLTLGLGATTRGVSGVAETEQSSFSYERWEMNAGLATLF